MSDRTVRCWGLASTGALGAGQESSWRALADREVSGLDDAWQLAVGGNNACVFRHTERTVMCWGSNAHLQLGRGPRVDERFTPVRVRGIEDVVEIDIGVFFLETFICARKLDQSVWCWGANNRGQLGNGGTTADSRQPARVAF